MKFLANLFGAQSADAKTLEQSRAQLAAAKASAETVAALFTAVPLDLDAMIAAGSDSLKAHIASVSAKDGELAAALAKATELEGKLATATTLAQSVTAQRDSSVSILTSIGFTPVPTSTEAEAKAAFDSHVKKAAALELAKAGHLPVAAVVNQKPANAAAIDQTLTGIARVEAAFKAQAKK